MTETRSPARGALREEGSRIAVERWWSVLDANSRRWLVENPGCAVLPRTLVNTINATTGGVLPGDLHGEFILSAQDQEFIRQKAAGSPDEELETGSG